MDDYISRQAAIDALKQQADTMSEWSERYAEQRRGVLTAVNIVEDLPPAQPEIIRCKDCQHSEYDAVYGDRYCHHNGKAEIVPDNHYCGYGERRTE